MLAAEPGLHGDPPQGGGSVVMAVRRVSGRYSEVMEQQPENGLALAPGPAQALSGVVEDGTGAAALEAAAGLVIEFVRGQFDGQSKLRRHAAG